jgi:hypothetical protein
LVRLAALLRHRDSSSLARRGLPWWLSGRARDRAPG